MIRRLLARFLRRPAEIRREAAVLVTMYGAQGAWIEARDRRRAAAQTERWEANSERRQRHWTAVMREIERQTGYRHQPDTATRMAGG
ncbi:hypothetical protein [Aurantimonas sp. A3-2-R12]|uniref:hypothetical protein n=1 Tax=Aurantimonas sp. A3-2-R12 TaxID=3114362 RepID=UPI002E18B5D0|nr:hypothetical protein [Aurantimonas sp. A3-2-R12]